MTPQASVLQQGRPDHPTSIKATLSDSVDLPSWDSNNYPVVGDVAGHHSVSSDLDMPTKLDGAHYLCARTYVGVTTELHRTCQRDLVKDKAVGADPGAGMDDDASGVGQHEPTFDMAVKVDFRLSDKRPKPMVQNPILADEPRGWLAPFLRGLILPNRPENFTPWIPEATDRLSVPVWLDSGNYASVLSSIHLLSPPILKGNTRARSREQRRYWILASISLVWPAAGFVDAPLKADVEAGKIDLLNALMAQVDLNRRLGAARQEIAAGNGIVADATYFASLRDRALRRTS